MISGLSMSSVNGCLVFYIFKSVFFWLSGGWTNNILLLLCPAQSPIRDRVNSTWPHHFKLHLCPLEMINPVTYWSKAIWGYGMRKSGVPVMSYECTFIQVTFFPSSFGDQKERGRPAAIGVNVPFADTIDCRCEMDWIIPPPSHSIDFFREIKTFYSVILFVRITGLDLIHFCSLQYSAFFFT